MNYHYNRLLCLMSFNIALEYHSVAVKNVGYSLDKLRPALANFRLAHINTLVAFFDLSFHRNSLQGLAAFPALVFVMPVGTLVGSGSFAKRANDYHCEENPEEDFEIHFSFVLSAINWISKIMYYFFARLN